MDKPRLLAAASFLPTLVGMILLDLALLPAALGGQGGVSGTTVWTGATLSILGGAILVARAGTRLRQGVLGGLLAVAVGLVVVGWVTHGQVGEFSDLAAVVTWMMALGAYLVFLGAALWMLATQGGRAILVLVLGLAGASFLVGLASVRWPAIPPETGPLFLVGLPLVALTLAVAGSMAMVLATGEQDVHAA